MDVEVVGEASQLQRSQEDPGAGDDAQGDVADVVCQQQNRDARRGQEPGTGIHLAWTTHVRRCWRRSRPIAAAMQLPMHRTMMVRTALVPAEDVPRESAAMGDWMDRNWSTVDDWVAERSHDQVLSQLGVVAQPHERAFARGAQAGALTEIVAERPDDGQQPDQPVIPTTARTLADFVRDAP